MAQIFDELKQIFGDIKFTKEERKLRQRHFFWITHITSINQENEKKFSSEFLFVVVVREFFTSFFPFPSHVRLLLSYIWKMAKKENFSFTPPVCPAACSPYIFSRARQAGRRDRTNMYDWAKAK